MRLDVQEWRIAMVIFLMCMIPVSAALGFFMCALCQAASAADRENERLFEQMHRKREMEAET